MSKEGYIKYPRIPYLDQNPGVLNKKVKVYEKLDGANCQFRVIDKEGKRQPMAGGRSKPIKNLGEEFGKYSWKDNFLKWVYSNPSIYTSKINPNHVFFGEWTHTHSISYPEKHKDEFFLIDIYDIEDEKFIDYEVAKDIVDELGLEKINKLDLLHAGNLDYNMLYSLMEGSDYGIDNKEGIVLKNYEDEDFAKLVNKEISDIRDNISYVESNRMDELATEYLAKEYENLRSSLPASNYGTDGEYIEKLTDVALNRFNIGSDLTSKIFNDNLYKLRFRQALKVKIKEKEGLV